MPKWKRKARSPEEDVRTWFQVMIDLRNMRIMIMSFDPEADEVEIQWWPDDRDEVFGKRIGLDDLVKIYTRGTLDESFFLTQDEKVKWDHAGPEEVAC